MVLLSATSDLLERAAVIVIEPNDAAQSYGIDPQNKTVNDLIRLPRGVSDVSELAFLPYDDMFQCM